MLPEWDGGGLLLGLFDTKFSVWDPGWETWCGGGPVLDDGPTFKFVWCRLLALLGPPLDPLLPPCGSLGGLIGSLFIFTGKGDVDGGGVLLDTARWGRPLQCKKSFVIQGKYLCKLLKIQKEDMCVCSYRNKFSLVSEWNYNFSVILR